MSYERIYLSINDARYRREYRQTYREIKQIYTIQHATRGLNNSFTVPSLRKKFIDHNATQDVKLPDWPESLRLLPGEWAKDVMTWYYPEGYQVSRAYHKKRVHAPQWYTGQVIGQTCVYFDLVGAYHQLYRRLWLDFTEPANKAGRRMSLAPIADALADWKAARNGAIGYLASHELAISQPGGQTWRISTLSSKLHYNNMLLYTINTICHELANLALKYGALYINTDCMIFADHRPWREFWAWLNRFGLAFRCIRGECNILGFSRYRIEGESLAGSKSRHATKNFEQSWRFFVDLPHDGGDHDPRAQRQLRLWRLPLKKVEKKSTYDMVEWWSKLPNPPKQPNHINGAN